MKVPKRDEEQQYRIPMVFVALPALLSLLDDQLLTGQYLKRPALAIRNVLAHTCEPMRLMSYSLIMISHMAAEQSGFAWKLIN